MQVQRPGIGQNIAIDMLLLRRLLAAFDSAQTILTQDIVPLLDEFAGRLFGELDYVAEGRNCEKFTDLYGSLPRIRTPKIQCALSCAAANRSSHQVAEHKACMPWSKGGVIAAAS